MGLFHRGGAGPLLLGGDEPGVEGLEVALQLAEAGGHFGVALTGCGGAVGHGGDLGGEPLAILAELEGAGVAGSGGGRLDDPAAPHQTVAVDDDGGRVGVGDLGGARRIAAAVGAGKGALEPGQVSPDRRRRGRGDHRLLWGP